MHGVARVMVEGYGAKRNAQLALQTATSGKRVIDYEAEWSRLAADTSKMFGSRAFFSTPADGPVQ